MLTNLPKLIRVLSTCSLVTRLALIFLHCHLLLYLVTENLDFAKSKVAVTCAKVYLKGEVSYLTETISSLSRSFSSTASWTRIFGDLLTLLSIFFFL